MVNTMRTQFLRTKDISAPDPASIGIHLQKLFEEAGEVATDVNKLTGRKKLKGAETMQDVRDNFIGELASNIQIIFILAQKAGFNYDDLTNAIDLENNDYQKYVDNL